ncbi:MAG: hypothetical protein DMF61_16955 [Blastocatellia bacterium AA13]|nr:MAG: hypothetical protein DMF61_16955 [Blastocatellia bacterium AA13]
MRRKVSLLAAMTFVGLLALQNYGCSGPGPDAIAPDDTFHPDLNEPKLKERLGEDDGYALAVMYGADIHGSLETCG